MISFWKFCSTEYMERRIHKRNQVCCALYQGMCRSNIEATKQMDRGCHLAHPPGHPMDHGPCPCPCLCPWAPHTKRRLPLAGDGESHGSLNFRITSIDHLPAGAGCCKSSHSPQATGVGQPTGHRCRRLRLAAHATPQTL